MAHTPAFRAAGQASAHPRTRRSLLHLRRRCPPRFRRPAPGHRPVPRRDRAARRSERRLLHPDGKGPRAQPLGRRTRRPRPRAAARRGAAHGPGMGKARWVVEHAFARLHQFERLRIRYERRGDLHQGLLELACCSLICLRRLRTSRLFQSQFRRESGASSAGKKAKALGLPRAGSTQCTLGSSITRPACSVPRVSCRSRCVPAFSDGRFALSRGSRLLAAQTASAQAANPAPRRLEPTQP